MAKRTTQTGLPDWEDTNDLEHVVKDKRSAWRGTPAKGRRRNRRYENRILRSQSLEAEQAGSDLAGGDLAEADWREEAAEAAPSAGEVMNIAEEADLDP